LYVIKNLPSRQHARDSLVKLVPGQNCDSMPTFILNVHVWNKGNGTEIFDEWPPNMPSRLRILHVCKLSARCWRAGVLLC